MTRSRSFALAGLLGLAFAVAAPTPAIADPPPWSAAWHKHKHKHTGKYCRHPSHRRVARYDHCGPIVERMRRDQSEIRRWKYSGRHEKAVRWYEQDLARARQELSFCRGHARHGRRPYYDRNDDPYYDDDSYDDYDRSGGSGLDLGRLLSGILGGF